MNIKLRESSSLSPFSTELTHPSRWHQVCLHGSGHGKLPLFAVTQFFGGRVSDYRLFLYRTASPPLIQKDKGFGEPENSSGRQG